MTKRKKDIICYHCGDFIQNHSLERLANCIKKIRLKRNYVLKQHDMNWKE